MGIVSTVLALAFWGAIHWGCGGNRERHKDTQPSKTVEYSSKDNVYKLTYDQANWEVKTGEDGSDKAQVRFEHKKHSLDVFIRCDILKQPWELEVLRADRVREAKEKDGTYKLLFSDVRVVNGKQVLCMIDERTVANTMKSYIWYYYSGVEGTVQLSAVMSRAEFANLRGEAEGLLNTLEINPSATAAAALANRKMEKSQKYYGDFSLIMDALDKKIDKPASEIDAAKSVANLFLSISTKIDELPTDDVEQDLLMSARKMSSIVKGAGNKISILIKKRVDNGGEVTPELLAEANKWEVEFQEQLQGIKGEFDLLERRYKKKI